MSSTTLRYAFFSVLVSLVVFCSKWWAYVITGSSLLFADAAETIINVVGAVAALFALWFAKKPADANHPYGHHKAEYLSAALEGAMMLATAMVTGKEAWSSFMAPTQPEHTNLGLAINGASGAINLIWAWVLLSVGRRNKSPALIASGRHVLTDVWATLAILGGFGLIAVTGWFRLEAVFTLMLTASILYASYGTLRGSVGALMDEVPDPELVPLLSDVIQQTGGGAIEAHDLRARVVGAITFAEFHLVVPSSMTVKVAHDICDRIEEGIRCQVGRAVIHIHVEPADKAKGDEAVVTIDAGLASRLPVQ